MLNVTANDNSGKPDASKVARPVWGWGWAVMPTLHHSMQIQLLSQIHALLMAQNNMLASVVQTENNRRARNAMGSALQTGESDIFRNERQGSGRAFGFTD